MSAFDRYIITRCSAFCASLTSRPMTLILLSHVRVKIHLSQGTQSRLTKDLNLKIFGCQRKMLKHPPFMRYKDQLDPTGPDEKDETR